MDDAGPPIATPSVCLWNSPLKIKNVVRRRNSSSSNIWSGNRFVRSWKVVSLFRRSLMTRRASVIGMLVYKETIHSIKTENCINGISYKLPD